MAKKLKTLKLDRIDLVDKGANAGALITLFKRDTMAEKPTPEKQIEDLTNQVADLIKRAEKAEADLVEAKKAVEKADEPEDILKNASPEVRARIEKAEKEAADAVARIAKLEEEGELATFAKRAEELGSVGITKVHAPILRKISKALSPEENKEFTRVLDAMSSLAKSSKLFESLGKDGETVSDPLAKLETLAKERVAKSSTPITYEQAYDAVLQTPEGKQLQADSRRN